MTKLIVLCLTASAAVTTRGSQRLQMNGFSPLPVEAWPANDNRPVAGSPQWYRRRP